VGVDEAGRGPLAGPMVVAAVTLPRAWIERGLPEPLAELNDSKQLTPRQRERLFEALLATSAARWHTALIDVATIDAINILRATHRGMTEAVRGLGDGSCHVLADGLPVPGLPWPQTALVRGDARSYSIAAASIIAKVTRDRLMLDYDRHYPGYGFAQHKGYGTADHLAALAALGPCPIHRRSFAPLRADPQGTLPFGSRPA
jgi:ribonuclease HII